MGVTLKFRKGDVITIDGSAGQVLKGEVQMVQPELSGDFGRIMEWADRVRRMTVRTNADTPADARAARSFGAEGIGLCRTEHMFFEGERIVVMREMILADDEKGRRAALDKLLPMQRLDFTSDCSRHARPAGDDPPARSAAARIPAEDRRGNRRCCRRHGHGAGGKLRQRVDALHEFNPMLGHRGCRLAISYPEIVEMQARAIFEAAVAAAHETGAPSSRRSWCRWSAFARARLRQGAHRRGRQGRHGRPDEDRLSGRHDDRAAARRPARPHRAERRILLLRHQRPDADDLRHLARRRLGLRSRPISARASSSRIPSSRSISTASAN
jgi:hypothetical protein